MANAFLKALSKMKLVELDESEQKAVAKSSGDEMTMEEIDRILAEEDKKAAAAPPAHPRQAQAAPAPQAAPRASAPSGAIPEDVPFERLYADASTPAATYPAEKLLKVLDGLKAMDPHTRKAAVLAMDAADDAWSVADAVLDAERKIGVLDKYRATLAQRVESMAALAGQEKAKRDEYIAKASDAIRTQITELEKKLQDETAKMAQEKAAIDASLESARATATREEARLNAEAQRLREVPQVFAISRTP